MCRSQPPAMHFSVSPLENIDAQNWFASRATSRITKNATITALRFFFEVTVGNKDVVIKLNTVPVAGKLPVVLSREEVARLLEATSSLKYKAAFSVAYGAGLLRHALPEPWV